MENIDINKLSEERLEICKSCPLYKEDSFYGPICNKMKWIKILDDGTEKISVFPREGFVRGCSCRLMQKTRNPKAHCIVKKW